MNRTKYLKLIPLMLMTVFLLSGCVSLQDLRDDHAIYTDKSEKEIIWQGRKYLYLTDTSESNFSPDYDFDNPINITDKEVPVLLAGYEGSFGYVSKDSVFISLYEKVYCLEEKYEEKKGLVENPPELKYFAYQYYEDDEYSTMHFEVLDTDKTKQLEDMLKACTVEKKDVDYMVVAEMYHSSKDGLFCAYNDITLCMNEEEQYFWDIYENEEYNLYKIPKEYNKTIEKVFEDAIRIAEENMEYWEEDEYEEYESY